jgi:hypothetical protein
VLQIASNAFIKSAKSIAQLLQFSIKSASNMLQMWLTSNSFKSEPNQRCKASPATVLQMLQKIIDCFKYATTMLHLLQKNTIAQDILQIYHTKLHDKTCQADLHQLQNCTKLELQMLQMASNSCKSDTNASKINTLQQ